jgi:Plasmid pRiA4b ORF-3-like protein.
MLYKIRVILDAEEDVFRDLAVSDRITLEDFHIAIAQSFGFDLSEMGTFFATDERWTQGVEYPIVDMGFDDDTVVMQHTPLATLLNENNPRLIYVYDLLAMWSFFVELAKVEEVESNELPELLFSFGSLPENAPDKSFKSERSTRIADEEDLFNEEGDEIDDFEDEFEDDFNDSSGNDFESFDDYAEDY